MAFAAENLNSRELMALLFLCEKRRRSVDLDEMLAAFADRIGNLSEEGRTEVLAAHLMSVEDVDIYNDEELKSLLTAHRLEIDEISHRLEKDPCFGGIQA